MRLFIQARQTGGKPKSVKRAAAVFFLLLFALLMCVLTAAALWAGGTYLNVTLEECLFYLSMPLQGTAKEFQDQIITRVLAPAGIAFGVLLLLLLLPRKKQLLLETKKRRISLLPLRMRPRTAALILLAWACVVLPYGNSILGIRRFFWNQLTQSPLIEENYADPAKTEIRFPKKKRNLITIYIESAESTNQDIENGGMMDRNYMPEMTALAKEYVSFSQSDTIEGAAIAPACGWTIAGMVAETGGIPLKMFTYSETRADTLGVDFISFLPGATFLGDILAREGYKTVFLCGSDVNFGGRKQLYEQHGNYEIYDYIRAKEEGRIPQDYRFGWGFEDLRLYAWAKEILSGLAASDQPFHLSFLTADTHDPGYLCPNCPDNQENIYGRTVRCSSAQLYDFVEWCRGQPFWDNTTIMIAGDHASMVKSLYVSAGAAEYDKHYGAVSRLVYNCFVNAAVPEEKLHEKNRRFTTMDLFPTTLAAMGCEIEGNRLGLGTDLFSGAPTLSEEMGYERLFEELGKKSIFYDTRLLR